IAFGEPERAAKVVEMPVRRMTRGKWLSVAAAGAMVLLFGRYGYEQFAPAPGGSRATVQAADGNVYRVQNAALQTVKPGTALEEGEVLRTAAGSRAVVKLMDGSVVEVGERAEFRVSAARRDLTVHLNRGAVIVQAAKRRQGHLYVATGDTRVAVTGTVFSVNRGSKGTRVSVVEGEVIVEFEHSDKVLHSGDQLATHRSVAAVPIDQEIAWSRNAPEHLKMLKDMATIKESVEKVRMPGVRFVSPLLDQVPANAVVFLSVPNLRDSFEDAQRLMTTELRRAGAASNPKVNEFVDRMAKLTEYMGEEFVVAMVAAGSHQEMVGIADVHRPGLKEFLEKEGKAFGGDAALQIVEGDQPMPSIGPHGMAVVIRGQRVAFGSNPALVESALAGNTGFASTPFGQRISQAFREGTGILFGVDLQSMIRGETKESERAMLSRAGADGVRYLVVEQETFNNKTQHSAVLNFDGPRQGLASWLAAPGPMGGLSYVSSRAQLATSVITKDPRLMIEELIAIIEAGGSNNRSELEQMQQALGVSFREDIAAALGSEVTFAIDGPLLPTPSWKLILEVNQPDRLQQAIAKMVASANAEMRRAGETGRDLKLESETSSQGIPMHRLTSAAGSAFSAYYTYRDGYMIAAPTKELVASAIRNRDAGMRLDTSGVFRRLLPTDQNANFSAIVYQNAEESLKLLSKVVPEDQGARDMVEKIGPTLIAAYALEDRIQVTTYGSSMDLLMQTAFAPMLHGQYHTAAAKKDRTAKTLRAYR
ncbi:MAG TPA: FecR domain-containing protein, partial [Bryobacteraceae bacterium]|nr:FecR domain-containing protein [Bryobacteraceae bacterium]